MKMVNETPAVVVKKSALDKAMHYLNDEWGTLTVFVTDARLSLDNNVVENSIRPFVIDRKKSLSSDTVSGQNQCEFKFVD